MIVDDLYIVGSEVLFVPTKAEAPLVVDANTVLPFTVAVESFQVVPGWGTRISQRGSSIKRLKAPTRGPFDGREAANELSGKESFRIAAAETADHTLIVSRVA